MPAAAPAEAGAALRARLSEAAEAFLATAWARAGAASATGVALVAVGGLGRQELTVASDLDLLVVHGDDAPSGSAAVEVARRLWPLLWECGVEVDHATRSVAESLRLAGEDPAVLLALLDARGLHGERGLAESLRSGVAAALRRRPGPVTAPLLVAAAERVARAGEVAFAGEPDLRDGRGGLRDVQLLRALVATWRTPAPAEGLRAAAEWLADVRGALACCRAYDEDGSWSVGQSRRRDERLRLEHQPRVAALLGVSDEDVLLARVAGAGRSIARALDRATADLAEAPASSWRGLRAGRRPRRAPLAEGVVIDAGRVVLAVGAEPEHDPALWLRAAAAAALAGIPLAQSTLERLAARTSPLPVPWTREVREELLRLLGAGAGAVPVIEDLDSAGLWDLLLPEWAGVRDRVQRNPLHAYTVDRHLLETVSRAAALVRGTDRPDLLLLGALLHDIGKGSSGNHSTAGADLAAGVAARLGLSPGDAATLDRLVRHHLLLANVATRRDLDDPVTVETVARLVVDRPTLDLLELLTRADGEATGPAAWSGWKAELVTGLVYRVRAVLGPAGGAGTDVPALPLPPPGPAGSADGVDVHLHPQPGGTLRVDVVANDHLGLLAQVAGVATLAGLDVLAARTRSGPSTAALHLTVRPRFGRLPDERRFAEEIRLAVAGRLPLWERLAARAADYAPVSPDPRSQAAARTAPPAVRVLCGAASTGTVVEVRAADRHGLLVALTAAVADCGIAIRSAHCVTLGHEVIDTFYLDAELAAMDPKQLTDRLLRAATADPPPGDAQPGGPAPR